MIRFILKTISFILFGIIPLGIKSQNMVWTNLSVSQQTDKYKFYCGVEERFFVPLEQKEFAFDYRLTFRGRVQPVVGLSLWERDNQEIRPYYGLDSKYFRVLLENRIYSDKTTNRLRARVSYKQKLTNWLSLVFSEEVFLTREFDHNRLLGGFQFKTGKLVWDLDYMSYYKDKNQNTLVFKLNYNL